jgi:type VI secretion system protein ImpH
VLFALIGLGDATSRARAGLPEEALLFYAGILAQRPLSAASLRGVLEDYFQVPVRVELFTGKWIEAPEEDRNAIGRARTELAGTLCLGDRFFDPALCFRMHLGPMGLAELQDFLPRASAAESLQRFLAFAAGPEQAFEYMLRLRAEEVPEPRLRGEGDGAQRLGWTMWLRSDEEPREACSGPFRQELEDPTRSGAGEAWK